MSKVVITVDTKEKEIEVTIDGTNVPLVDSVHIYSGNDNMGCCCMPFGIDINVEEMPDEDGDLKKHTRLHAERESSIKFNKVLTIGEQIAKAFEDNEKYRKRGNI